MRPWLVGLLAIVLAACGGSSDTADGGDSEAADGGPSGGAEAAPTEPATEVPPTPTPEPLTESEEQDESDFFENAVGFQLVLPGNFGQTASLSLTHSVTKGPLQVTVVRAGPFTISGKASGEENYYRLDLKIENVGDQTGIFEPEGMVLADEGDNEYGLRRDASSRVLNWPLQIVPEAVERGYVLFEPLPEQVKTIGFTFKIGPDDFEYELKLVGEE